jgi:hypothetical protein
MSCSLPQEILDLIVDHLRDEPTTLKSCCVVSKSWIHRTRTHLFARVEFHAPKSHVELWRKIFSDPSRSPVHHTRHLSICGLALVTAADADTGGWIRTFRNFVHLHLESIDFENDNQVSLVPFYGLSPTLTSLRIMSTSSEILELICSFPLLEDLALVFLSLGGDAWDTPSTSPKLTGSLELVALGAIRPAARRLLSLPGGLRFAKIDTSCLKEDVKSITDLVSRCSDTLESLKICYCIPGAFSSASMSGQCLTATCGCSHSRDAPVRSLQGHKTQRVVVSMGWAGCSAGHYGAPDCALPKPPTDRHPLIRQICKPG